MKLHLDDSEAISLKIALDNELKRLKDELPPGEFFHPKSHMGVVRELKRLKDELPPGEFFHPKSHMGVVRDLAQAMKMWMHGSHSRYVER